MCKSKVNRYDGEIIIPFSRFETDQDIEDVDVENLIYKSVMENLDECRIEISNVEEV